MAHHDGKPLNFFNLKIAHLSCLAGFQMLSLGYTVMFKHNAPVCVTQAFKGIRFLQYDNLKKKDPQVLQYHVIYMKN